MKIMKMTIKGLYMLKMLRAKACSTTDECSQDDLITGTIHDAFMSLRSVMKLCCFPIHEQDRR